MSTRPKNGAPRTAPRSSPTISISPDPAARRSRRHRDRGLARDGGPLPPRRVPTRSPPSAMCCRRAPLARRARRGSSRSATRKTCSSATASTIAFSSSTTRASVIGGYDKIHLVPFGEYLPFQDFLESLGIMQLTGVRGGFSAGTGPRLLTIPGAPPATPAHLLRDHFSRRDHRDGAAAGLAAQRHQRCVVRSSAGPYQHFHQAQVRAVEQGLPVVRAANTGISAVIDPYGRVLAEIGLDEKGVIDADLPKVGPRDSLCAVRNRSSKSPFLALRQWVGSPAAISNDGTAKVLGRRSN